jgi:hypothetical protein
MDSQAGEGWSVSFGIKRINGTIGASDMAGTVARAAIRKLRSDRIQNARARSSALPTLLCISPISHS